MIGLSEWGLTMKGITILLSVVGGGALFILGTCAVVNVAETMDEQKAAAIALHQKQVEQAIAAKKVAVGMTTEEVVKAWGKPRKIDQTTTGQHSHENWFYDPASLVIFMDGKVRSVTVTR